RAEVLDGRDRADVLLRDVVYRRGRAAVQARAREALRPSERPALRVEPAFHARHHERPVVAVPHVFLAAPDQLHCAGRHRLSDLHRLLDVIVRAGETPPEAAAELLVVDDDLVLVEAGGACGDIARAQWVLRAAPDLQASTRDARGG